MKLFHILRKNEGMSLIEILVALIVFAIGILAVVRIFPGGMFTVKQTENATLASRLAQAELERWKSRSENLPLGILALGPDGSIQDSVDPDDLDVLANLPGGTNPYYFTDLNKFRHIESESTTIPVPSPTAWDNGSVYVLAFAPIVWNTTDPANSIKVYSGPMRRRFSTNMLRSSADYAIDYDEAVIYVNSATYDRKFYIKYSYWQTGGSTSQLEAVPVQLVTIPSGATQASIPGPTGGDLKSYSGFNGVEQGSDSLRRGFTQIADTQAWSTTDPYEYKVKNAVSGVLAFSPLGYGYDEITTRGRVKLTAYIDYDVLDWHIISEERKVPGFATSSDDSMRSVKLTLRFLKNRSESVEADGTEYKGLEATQLAFDLVAVDLDTGAVYTDQSPEIREIDYKEGIVYFDSSVADHTFRIYYKADLDWGMQVYKSYDKYTEAFNGSALTYSQYYANNNKVYFAECSKNRAVAVDYVARLSDGTILPVNGEVHTVSDDGLTYSIDLAKSLDSAGHAGASVLKVTNVYGVTVGAKVIWRDGGVGFRAGRWKKVDLQTYLTCGKE